MANPKPVPGWSDEAMADYTKMLALLADRDPEGASIMENGQWLLMRKDIKDPEVLELYDKLKGRLKADAAAQEGS